jgi:hypothetical protein
MWRKEKEKKENVEENGRKRKDHRENGMLKGTLTYKVQARK